MISFQQAGNGCYVVPVHLGRLKCPHAYTAPIGLGSVAAVGSGALLSDCLATEQHASPEHFEAVAAAVAVVDLDQSVHGFGVGVGHAPIEVVEDRVAPVLGGGHELRERSLQLGRQGVAPLIEHGLGRAPVLAVVDAVEGLFGGVASGQLGEVIQPRFHDQPLFRFEARTARQQVEAILDQAPTLGRRQASPQALADGLHADVSVLQDVPLIDDREGVRQQVLAQPAVRLPHVHRQHLDPIAVRHSADALGHRVVVAVWKQVDQRLLADVGQHAAGVVEQMHFVDAEDFRRLEVELAHLGLGPMLEHPADGAFVQPGVTGDRGEGGVHAALADPFVEPARHHKFVVEVGVAVGRGLAAVPAQVALAVPFQRHRLASGLHIHVAHDPCAVGRQTVRVAVVADRVRFRPALDADGDRVVRFHGPGRVDVQTPHVEYVGQPLSPSFISLNCMGAR